jgi:hypothetical protein
MDGVDETVDTTTGDDNIGLLRDVGTSRVVGVEDLRIVEVVGGSTLSKRVLGSGLDLSHFGSEGFNLTE